MRNEEPTTTNENKKDGLFLEAASLRDYFAGTIQLTQSELSQFSDCDDQDLLQRFGTPEDIEQGFQHVSAGRSMPVLNILLRAKLESRGRAALRYLESDAMLAARRAQ